MKTINRDYPIFVLSFCLFQKKAYTEQVVPAFQDLKFRYFGHDMVIFHEVDIRKSRPPFDILMNPEIRQAFLADLGSLIESAPFTIVASCIQKEPFVQRCGSDGNPYHVAMEFGLERIYMALQELGQRERKTHVVFEQRGLKEDQALELEFRRIMDRTRMEGMAETLELVLADKKTNSSGLQLADMVARPIGRHLLRPDQPNRAYETLKPKFRRDAQGRIEGRGLKCYP